MYRDSITFQCNEINRVNITESLQSLSVNFHRKSKRQCHHIHFAEACISLRKDLADMCTEVRNWLPSIEVHVGFPCDCSATAPQHFVYLEDKHREATFYCKSRDNKYTFSPQQKWWLPVTPPAGKVSELAFEITTVCVCFWSVVVHRGWFTDKK